MYPLEVSLELKVQDLKAILEVELAMNASEMLLLHNMTPMAEDGRSLGDYKVEDGDIIVLSDSKVLQEFSGPTSTSTSASASASASTASMDSLPLIDWSSVRLPEPKRSRNTTSPQQQRQQQQGQPSRADPNDPEVIRRHLLSHPNELALLRQQNPPLARAFNTGDPQVFRQALADHMRAMNERNRQRIRMLNANPFDSEVQQRIAQDIQQQNIEDNMQAAMEFTPESFSRIVMLYVVIKVNGVEVKALVDSGAASTIMSDRCAERCGIMRLVDRRFAGVAVGVGKQTIIGKVHLGTIQIGEDFLTSSFQVLQDQNEDMLLGLDMLRRHQVRCAHVCDICACM